MLVLSIVSLVCMKFVGAVLHMDNVITYFVWGTEKILPVVTSVFLFLAFERVDVSNTLVKRCLSFIAPAVFGVYLFHIGDLQTWLFREVFNNEITYTKGLMFLGQMLLAMISIFVVGIAIDKMRIWLLERPFMKYMEKIILRLDKKSKDYIG